MILIIGINIYHGLNKIFRFVGYNSYIYILGCLINLLYFYYVLIYYNE